MTTKCFQGISTFDL